MTCNTDIGYPSIIMECRYLQVLCVESTRYSTLAMPSASYTRVTTDGLISDPISDLASDPLPSTRTCAHARRATKSAVLSRFWPLSLATGKKWKTPANQHFSRGGFGTLEKAAICDNFEGPKNPQFATIQKAAICDNFSRSPEPKKVRNLRQSSRVTNSRFTLARAAKTAVLQGF